MPLSSPSCKQGLARPSDGLNFQDAQEWQYPRINLMTIHKLVDLVSLYGDNLNPDYCVFYELWDIGKSIF
jgi:hypothetical protein